MSLFDVHVYTQLKNTDLHALSAYEAITQIMNFERLKSLYRYGSWTLTLEASSQEEANDTVKKILDNSYYILNPNKESYVLNTLPSLSAGEHDCIKLLTVKQSIAFDDQSLIQKIKQKVGISLHRIDNARIWVLKVDKKGVSDTDINMDITTRIVKTSSRQNGLLVNPFYETYTLTDAYATSAC